MIVVGTDKQQLRDNSTYPFTGESPLNMLMGRFDPGVIDSCVFYVRQHTTCPLRIVRICTYNSDLILILGNSQYTQLARAVITPQSEISVFADAMGRPFGIIRGKRIYQALFSIVKYGFSGDFQTSEQDFILDPVTYVPYKVSGVQYITVGQTSTSAYQTVLQLTDNIVLQSAHSGANTISAYSYVPNASGAFTHLRVQGTADAIDISGKHVIIKSTPQSDVRVVTRPGIITFVGACDV